MTENNTKKFQPNDIVKVCPHLQIGLSFLIGGIRACVMGSSSSPSLVSTEEIKAGKLTHDLIVQRRRELFEAINGLRDIPIEGCANCAFLKEVPYKEVNFEYCGGFNLPSSMSIQHYTACNERCEYCCYAQKNEFFPPQYDILKIYDLFKAKGKLRGDNWIDLSGGEPALLKDLDKILTYFDENNMGTVVVYSNASIYSPKIYELLKKNKIILTTSVDTGMASIYKKMRGLDAFPKVMENLIKYRNSGTSNLWLKYVITETNRNEDSMWSFIMAMLAIRPNRIMICPDFPYGDRQIPEETVDFAAKLWYLLEKHTGKVPIDYTSEFGDQKYVKYHKDLAEKIARLKAENPIDESTILKYSCSCATPVRKNRKQAVKKLASYYKAMFGW